MTDSKKFLGVGDTIVTPNNKSYTITKVEFPDAGIVRYVTVSSSRYDNSTKCFTYTFDSSRMSSTNKVGDKPSNPYVVTTLGGKRVNLKTVRHDRYNVSAVVTRPNALYSNTYNRSFDSFDEAREHYVSLSASPAYHELMVGVKCGNVYAPIDMSDLICGTLDAHNDEKIKKAD